MTLRQYSRDAEVPERSSTRILASTKKSYHRVIPAISQGKDCLHTSVLTPQSHTPIPSFRYPCVLPPLIASLPCHPSPGRPHVLARISGPCSAALTHGHLRDAMMDVIRALLIDENCTAECQPPTTPADQSPITADAPPPAPTEGTASPLPPLPPLSPSIGDDGLPLLLVEVRAAEDPRGELKIDATWTRAGGSIAGTIDPFTYVYER